MENNKLMDECCCTEEPPEHECICNHPCLPMTATGITSENAWGHDSYGYWVYGFGNAYYHNNETFYLCPDRYGQADCQRILDDPEDPNSTGWWASGWEWWKIYDGGSGGGIEFNVVDGDDCRYSLPNGCYEPDGGPLFLTMYVNPVHRPQKDVKRSEQEVWEDRCTNCISGCCTPGTLQSQDSYTGSLVVASSLPPLSFRANLGDVSGFLELESGIRWTWGSLMY